jgi:hypothetical protein
MSDARTRVFEFQLDAERGLARAGTLTLPHGEIQTPAFMPVGTHGVVRGLHPDEVRRTGAQIILGNTYHLHLRPGEQTSRRCRNRLATGSAHSPTRRVPGVLAGGAGEITEEGDVPQPRGRKPAHITPEKAPRSSGRCSDVAMSSITWSRGRRRGRWRKRGWSGA